MPAFDPVAPAHARRLARADRIGALLLLALAACREPTPREAARPARPAAAAAAATSLPVDDDTGTVRTTGAIVVAAFPATQAQIDANADLNEAFSDFQYGLPGIAAGLREGDVRLAVRYARPVRIEAGGRTLTWSVSADSGGVGYLLLAPGRPARILWGVHTNSDVVDAASAYLAPDASILH